jgi:hypothetical protein
MRYARGAASTLIRVAIFSRLRNHEASNSICAAQR